MYAYPNPSAMLQLVAAQWLQISPTGSDSTFSWYSLIGYAVMVIALWPVFVKGGVFSFFLLWLLPVIGYLIIGYGGARYRGQPGPRAAG